VAAAVAMSVVVALTIVVATSASLGVDARAFQIANDLRAPWLDHAARLVTTLGLIAIVGPALVAGAAFLVHRLGHVPSRALLAGGTLAWVGAWLVKAIVDRRRPPVPLVETSGQSYPPAHAATPSAGSRSRSRSPWRSQHAPAASLRSPLAHYSRH
jgi:hypothetical protein